MTVLDRCVGGQTKNQHGKASAKRALLNFNYYNEEIFHAEGTILAFKEILLNPFQ